MVVIQDNQDIQQQLGDRLQQLATGCQLTCRGVTMTRRLDGARMQRVASEFDASRDSIRSSKRILDSKHPAIRKITSLLNEARAVWYYRTFAYQDGLRLVRIDMIAELQVFIAGLKEDLEEAKQALRESWPDIREDAKQRLGQLYDESDYEDVPSDIAIELSFPSVEADSRLLQVLPQVYDQERERVRLQFEKAAADAQRTLLEEFVAAIEHLQERLTEDGTAKKVIRESAVLSIREFADKLRTMSIVDDASINELAGKAAALADAVSVEKLRANSEYRDVVRAQLQTIVGEIEVIDAPKRKFDLA